MIFTVTRYPLDIPLAFQLYIGEFVLYKKQNYVRTICKILYNNKFVFHTS